MPSGLTKRVQTYLSPSGQGAWPIRITWFYLPLLAGPAFQDALDEASRPVQIIASIGLWSAWAAILVATLVPATVTLTAVRILAPGALAATLLAAVVAVADGDQVTGWHVVAVTGTTITLVAALLPSTSAVFVNGSSYGDEVRMPLRVPAPLVLGPIQAAWLVTMAGAVSGPLLLAAKQWVTGGLALALGLPAVLWGVRVLHTLAQRWTVFVPGGLVLHDPLTLVHPVLLRRGTITSLEPAPADTEAVDLTAGALGLAVEARVQRPLPLLLTSRDRGRGKAATEVLEADALLFTPAQPGAFLTAARSRRL